MKISQKIVIGGLLGVCGAVGLSDNTFAASVKSEDISNRTYVIGTHLYDRSVEGDYKGYVSTNRLMLAAKTLAGDTINDMDVYYKNARGNWVDGVTGEAITDIPETFDIQERNDHTYSAPVVEAVPAYSVKVESPAPLPSYVSYYNLRARMYGADLSLERFSGAEVYAKLPNHTYMAPSSPGLVTIGSDQYLKIFSVDFAESDYYLDKIMPFSESTCMGSADHSCNVYIRTYKLVEEEKVYSDLSAPVSIKIGADVSAQPKIVYGAEETANQYYIAVGSDNEVSEGLVNPNGAYGWEVYKQIAEPTDGSIEIAGSNYVLGQAKDYSPSAGYNKYDVTIAPGTSETYIARFVFQSGAGGVAFSTWSDPVTIENPVE